MCLCVCIYCHRGLQSACSRRGLNNTLHPNWLVYSLIHSLNYTTTRPTPLCSMLLPMFIICCLWMNIHSLRSFFCSGTFLLVYLCRFFKDEFFRFILIFNNSQYSFSVTTSSSTCTLEWWCMIGLIIVMVMMMVVVVVVVYDMIIIIFTTVIIIVIVPHYNVQSSLSELLLQFTVV